MDVWGKRRYEVAFPNNAIFGTILVTDEIFCKKISNSGATEMKIDGGAGGLFIQGANMTVVGDTVLIDGGQHGTRVVSENVPYALQVEGNGLSCSNIKNAVDISGAGIGVHGASHLDMGLVVDAGLSASFAVLNPDDARGLTTPFLASHPGGTLGIFSYGGLSMNTVGSINIVTAGMDMVSTTGSITIQSPENIDLITDTIATINGSIIPSRNYINTTQVTYTPCGAGFQNPIPDVGTFWLYQANTLTSHRGFDITIAGVYDGIALSANQMEWQIVGGPMSGDVMFSAFTNALTSQPTPFNITFQARMIFDVVSVGGAGVCRTNFLIFIAREGGDGPERITQLTQDATIDSTVVNDIRFRYRTGEATANLSTKLVQSYYH